MARTGQDAASWPLWADMSTREWPPSPVAIPNVGRVDLARHFRRLGFLRGVELGVEQGAFAEVLLAANPTLELHCVDAWQAYRGYRDHVRQAKLDRFYEATTARLSRFPHVRLVRAFSQDAARTFHDGSLDFVYIDANHALEFVVADLAAWSPKVRPGGIIAGHDYARHRAPDRIHVVQAIQAWTSAYAIAPWFLVGREAKVEGETRDSARSWFWFQRQPCAASRRIRQ
jgi:hypothetical protein